MRDIKFRGKRVDNGEWIIGSLMVSGDSGYIFEGGFDRSVIPETVGQFTGLKDTFGGDIIEDENGNRAVISWSNDQAGFCLETIDNEYSELLPMDKLDWKLEIVGNIHDNPELLEASK